jgi:hypothetical protein
MTARQIASLFIRLVAIYMLVRALPSILSVGSSVAGFKNVGYSLAMPVIVASVAGLVLFLVLMALVISRSDWFATHLIKAQDVSLSLGSLSAVDIQSIAFSWIGLLLLADGVTGLVYQLSQLHRLSMAAGDVSAKVMFADKIYSSITSNASSIVIGAVLFVFPGSIARLWQAIQGTRPMKS